MKEVTMKNLKISVPLVDDSLLPVNFRTGKELIDYLITDDWGTPPKSMIIEAISDDGNKVIVNIPYSESNVISTIIKKVNK